MWVFSEQVKYFVGPVCVRPMENSLLEDSMSSETSRDGSNIFLLLKKKKH